MAPPAFSDLGKEARDVLSRNYRKCVSIDLRALCVPFESRFWSNFSSSQDKSTLYVLGVRFKQIFACAFFAGLLLNSLTAHTFPLSSISVGLKKKDKHNFMLSIKAKLSSFQSRTLSVTDIGVVKLDVKTKTPVGIQFNVNGVSNNDTGKVTAFLESSHSLKDYGLTIKEKWNADNTLSTDVSLKDCCLNGLDLGATGFFAPQSGRKNGTLKGAFKNDTVHLKSDLNVDHPATILKSSLVLQ